eukprot:gnl/MRDRNA2_/MRDRNA2_117665_c0_seq1.p1 gnl/MRDRNA2_/MRDRNA2_117665_c0~~gnl/MRDRNA2_/MRDRNA2_117665_c0_seq1.p1  ORF type:complete len:512 (-),score=100.86 gnl/MRDRNA2_/MRDRNA2_117665_c0_seq1:30-1565(-)
MLLLRMRRAAKFIATGGFCTGAVVAGAIYYDPELRRGAKFWWRVGPIVAHYKLASMISEDKDAEYQRLHQLYAPDALRLILDFRGLYVKFAQVASVRPEFVPVAYREEFAKCQDAVPSQPLDVRAIVEEELGLPFHKLFQEFDPEPCGAASIGQTHRAVGLDGRQLVIKLQYPGAKKLFHMDFGCIQTLVGWSSPEALPALNEFRNQFMNEFDYEQESLNLQAVHQSLTNGPFGDRFVVPELVPELSSKHVITMTYLPGTKLDTAVRTRLQSLGVDTSKRLKDWIKDPGKLSTEEPASSSQYKLPSWLARILVSDTFLTLSRWVVNVRQWLYLRTSSKSVLDNPEKLLHDLLEVHGYEVLMTSMFNADPHPGNILLLEDGRIGLIDYGQCKVSSPKFRQDLARLMVSIQQQRVEDTADAFRSLGLKTENDDSYFIAQLARLIFDRIRPEIMDRQFHVELHSRDKVVEFPPSLLMVYRVAVLLRGLALTLQCNVSVADSWAKIAAQVPQESL